MRAHHPGADLGGPGVFGRPIDGVGDVLGYAVNYHDPTLTADGVDVLDLERDAGERGVGQLDPGLGPDRNRVPVQRVVDGKDLRLPVTDDGQSAEMLTLQEGEALLFADLHELSFLSGRVDAAVLVLAVFRYFAIRCGHGTIMAGARRRLQCRWSQVAGRNTRPPDHLTTVEDVHLVERGQLVEPVGDVEEARVGGGHQDVVDQPWFVQSRGRLVEDEH